ncbi:MAG: hypothetical protein U1E45_19055 [Geminicoccaceae bacterium]
MASLRFMGILVAGLLATVGSARADPLDKPAITRSDLVYLGAFAVPGSACGRVDPDHADTMFTSAGIALRRVNGALRFFGAVHVYSGSLVYEMAYPGLGPADRPPVATVVGEPCDVYRGRKTSSDNPGTLDGGLPTHGLMWDAARGRLYWSYGHWYDTFGDNPVLGWARLGPGGTVTAHGPWRFRTVAGIGPKAVRGGTTRIPKWFADRFTGGATLGLGFGGYYSIIGTGGGQLGPALVATTDPGDATTRMRAVPLLGHPVDHPAARDTSYRSLIDGSPTGGRGRWQWSDSIEGAGVWIDTPTKQGMLFVATMGTGRIAYEGGTITTEGWETVVYVYHPRQLAEVAAGTRKPWQATPSSRFTLTLPAGVRVSGAAFDPVQGRLYLHVLAATRATGAIYPTPLVVAYRVRG